MSKNNGRKRCGDEEQHDGSEDRDRGHEHRRAAPHGLLVHLLAARVADVTAQREQPTAELLGNAALGVLALVVIWGLLQTLGVDIVRSLREALIH